MPSGDTRMSQKAWTIKEAPLRRYQDVQKSMDNKEETKAMIGKKKAAKAELNEKTDIKTPVS